MRYKAIIIIISISAAFVFMTGGYGFWQKELVIKAHIDIVAPPVEKEVIAKDEITAGTVIEGETLEGVKDTSTEKAENAIVTSGSVENTDSKELSK